MIEYNKRLVEVFEILKHLSQNDYDKIPEEIKEVIETNKDKEYIWKYDDRKKLKDQDVPNDTIAILSYINAEYLLNEEQKKFVEKLHERNEKNTKSIDYNTDIFYQKRACEHEGERELMVEPKHNFLHRLKDFIKRIFVKAKK